MSSILACPDWCTSDAHVEYEGCTEHEGALFAVQAVADRSSRHLIEVTLTRLDEPDTVGPPLIAVDSLELTPDQARTLARTLVDLADRAG